MKKLMHIKRANEGFTLIELLLYFALFGIFTLLISQFFLTTLETKIAVSNRSGVEVERDIVLHKMVHDIRYASSISAPSLFDSPSSELILTIDGDTHRYYVENSRLILTINGVDHFLTSSVIETSSFLVTKQGELAPNPVINITAQMQGLNQQQIVQIIPLSIYVHTRF